MDIDVKSLDLTTKIIADLAQECSITESDTENYTVLQQKVYGAVREVIRVRNYPQYYADDIIEEDLERYYSAISRIALFDYNQAGAEGETMHIENNTQRMWRERTSLFYGITPIVRVV